MSAKNKVKKRGINVSIILKKQNNLMCTIVLGGLLEGLSDTFESLGKPDKTKFLKRPKQTELAKHRCGVIIMQSNMFMTTCNWYDIYYTTVKQLCFT